MSSADEEVLREVVEALAPIERRAGSAGETQAAGWIAARLRAAGARDVRVEHVEFRDGYAVLLLPLGVTGLLAGLAGAIGRPGPRRRAVAALASAVATGFIVDDVSNGLRPWRRLITRPKPTTNVIAEAGDPDAERTLVVMAHHDAAPTGAVFDQTLHHKVAARIPGVIARIDTSLPLWWPIAGAPGLAALGALLGRRKLSLVGALGATATTVLGADIARNRIVPGANDNLSAVGALVALAERFREKPAPGVRLLLVSLGAEEVLQGGIHAFVATHLRRLDPEATWVLNLDTIGSPELILVEGEGPFWMEDYCDPSFRDRIARVTQAATGAPIHRGARSRASSDAVIASRAGYPTAMIASWDEHRALSNYHLMTDTPDRLRYDTVARAVELTDALARDLAGSALTEGEHAHARNGSGPVDGAHV